MNRLTLCSIFLLFSFFSFIPPASASESSLGLEPAEKENLLNLKRQLFGGLSFQIADQIEQGLAEPLLEFTVSDSLFVNWVIPRKKVAALSEALNLPPGFRLAPIRILNGERAKYYLSLNLYQVTIDQPSFRAEWSVYVTKEGDPEPRFLIIEAASSTDSFDPVAGGVPAVPFQFERKNGKFSSTVTGLKSQFSIRFTEPRFSFPRTASSQWAKANDLIYWSNGVADKAYYNGSLTQQNIIKVRPHQVELTHESPWAQFTRQKPKHIFLYDKPIEFALTPWANLQDANLAIDPAAREQLQAIKAQVFASLTRFKASQVIQGQGNGIFNFTVSDAVPAYFINFRVPYHKVEQLRQRLALPDNLELVPVSPFKYRLPNYLISLNVYLGEGIAAGLRAEWSVYVAEKDNRSQPYFLVIDAATSAPSLDPVNLFTDPAQVFNYQVDEHGLAKTEIEFQSGSFKVSFPVPTQARALPINPRWVRANDRVYWLNGVYDRLFYSALVTDPELAIINRNQIAIEDRTPWADYIEPRPISAFIFTKPLEYKINPWFNVESL